MRNLNNSDLFKVMRILRKTNIKQHLLKLDLPRDENGNLNLSENEYGAMLIFQVIEVIPDAEQEIFSFLADVAGVTTEEMMNDEFDLLLRVIEHLKGQDKLVRFLKLAFDSVGMTNSTSSTSSTSVTQMSAASMD